MRKSETYRTQAVECLHLAQTTMHRKALYMSMRECWLALAARADLAENGTSLDPANRFPSNLK